MKNRCFQPDTIYEDGKKITLSYINDSTYIRIKYYDNGKPLTITTKNSNHVAHGESILYYPSGGIEVKGYYKNGEKYGVWYFYSESGHLDKLVEYFGHNINQEVYFTKDMQIDTTIEGRNFVLS